MSLSHSECSSRSNLFSLSDHSQSHPIFTKLEINLFIKKIMELIPENSNDLEKIYLIVKNALQNMFGDSSNIEQWIQILNRIKNNNQFMEQIAKKIQNQEKDQEKHISLEKKKFSKDKTEQRIHEKNKNKQQSSDSLKYNHIHQPAFNKTVIEQNQLFSKKINKRNKEYYQRNEYYNSRIKEMMKELGVIKEKLISSPSITINMSQRDKRIQTQEQQKENEGTLIDLCRHQHIERQAQQEQERIRSYQISKQGETSLDQINIYNNENRNKHSYENDTKDTRNHIIDRLKESNNEKLSQSQILNKQNLISKVREVSTKLQQLRQDTINASFKRIRSEDSFRNNQEYKQKIELIGNIHEKIDNNRFGGYSEIISQKNIDSEKLNSLTTFKKDIDGLFIDIGQKCQKSEEEKEKRRNKNSNESQEYIKHHSDKKIQCQFQNQHVDVKQRNSLKGNNYFINQNNKQSCICYKESTNQKQINFNSKTTDFNQKFVSPIQQKLIQVKQQSRRKNNQIFNINYQEPSKVGQLMPINRIISKNNPDKFNFCKKEFTHNDQHRSNFDRKKQISPNYEKFLIKNTCNINQQVLQKQLQNNNFRNLEVRRNQTISQYFVPKKQENYSIKPQKHDFRVLQHIPPKFIVLNQTSERRYARSRSLTNNNSLSHKNNQIYCQPIINSPQRHLTYHLNSTIAPKNTLKQVIPHSNHLINHAQYHPIRTASTLSNSRKRQSSSSKKKGISVSLLERND